MTLSNQFIGQKVKVTASDGTELFTLNSGGTEVKVTVKDLYNTYKIQWFEPEANDYLPLTSIDSHFPTSDKVKHFSWKNVADFAMVDRGMLDYRTGGSGDWKAAKNGASGYVLVDVSGKPYWADGVGQIPFAVDSFKHNIADGNSEEAAIKATLESAQRHSTGNIIPSWNPVVTNQYDDYFVLRGAIWASKRYDAERKTREKFNPRTGDSVEIPYFIVIDKNGASPDELGNSLPASVPKKYGLIK